MATTIQIPVPDHVILYLSANAHAAQTQYLKYWTADGSASFSGTGEGVAMTTPDGQTVAIINNRRGGGFLFLSFSASGNANPRVQNPVTSHNGNTYIITVTSEDDQDDDNNDTYAVITYTVNQKPVRQGLNASMQVMPLAIVQPGGCR